MAALAALMQPRDGWQQKTPIYHFDINPTSELLLDFHAVACLRVNANSINSVRPTGVW